MFWAAGSKSPPPAAFLFVCFVYQLKAMMIYFAGGGVSVNEETARNDTYNTKVVWPDYMANVTMNMGGLASAVEGRRAFFHAI